MNDPAPERAVRRIHNTAAAAVAALAVITGAVSYSHLRLLELHGETGWRAHAFPLSVDGLEIVASLILPADRRLARRSRSALSSGQTQAEIAERIGVSQMHVSRLLTRTLAELRTRLLAED